MALSPNISTREADKFKDDSGQTTVAVHIQGTEPGATGTQYVEQSTTSPATGTAILVRNSNADGTLVVPKGTAVFDADTGANSELLPGVIDRIPASGGSIAITGRTLGSTVAKDVAIVDGSGNQITSFGGGTQYTEDVPAAADPVGTTPILVRKDTPAAITSTDGDNIAQRATNYGAAFVQVVSSTGSFVDTFGGGTQYAEGTTNATPTGTAMLGQTSGDVLKVPQLNSSNQLEEEIFAKTSDAFWPEPALYLTAQSSRGAADNLQVDSDKNLMTRGPVTTDEGSFRDEFAPSNYPSTTFEKNLTGTVTFTNGSATITGSGTAFLTELTHDMYVKLSTDATSAWMKVRGVLSNTSAVLDDVYTGTGGAGTGHRTFWKNSTASGTTYTIGSNNLTVTTGTTSGGHFECVHDVDYLPMVMNFSLQLSQKIANQRFRIGFFDSTTTSGAGSNNAAYVEFTAASTTITNCVFVTQSGPNAADTLTSSALTITSPATAQLFRIEIVADAARLYQGETLLVTHKNKLPNFYSPLFIAAFTDNTAAAGSTTTVTIDFLSSNNLDAFALTGLTTPVQIGGALGTAGSPLITKVTNTTPGASDEGMVVRGAGSFTAAQATASNLNAQVVGNAASAASDSGNPVKVGALGKTSLPTGVTDGQRVNSFADKYGRLIVKPHGMREIVTYQTTTITSSTSETTVGTAVASTFLELHTCIVANSSATDCTVTFKDATAGSTRFTVHCPGRMTIPVYFSPEYPQNAVNNNWTATCSASVASIYITMGFIKVT